ncbi:MAG TPA: PDZ domain-containing protein [Pyrinomonadaceae bacterium]|nr:PDZ domain-containing protein [Pyrinomonadaceae bacterium]
MKTIVSRLQFTFMTALTLVLLGTAALAQTAASAPPTPIQSPPVPARAVVPEKIQPRRRPMVASTPPAKVTVIPDQQPVAPQVVTIVHRLSGIKMLRFLLRQAGEAGTVAMIDPLSMTSDAHASIVAGWAIDEKTITARLPQAAAEIDFFQAPLLPAELSGMFPDANSRSASTVPRAQPDLTVITRDGRRLAARYVGLDGMTGLSVLQVVGMVAPSPAAVAPKSVTMGQTIQVFAPERTSPSEATPGIIYVRVGETEAKVSGLARLSSGKLQRLTVHAVKLSPVVVGGVACDASGNTLGIVEAIEGNNASLVPAEAVRDAARRVLERQASVPRPLLGIRGEPVEFSPRTLFVANGWREDQLTKLVGDQEGILLLQVMPGTPAAFAELRRGDVIMKVNNDAVKSAEDFSALLGDAGSGEQVKFTVLRPDAVGPFAISVKLGAAFDQPFNWQFEMPRVNTAQGGLESVGIETVPLSARAASQMAAKSGLLVVAIQPQSVAARSGLREGDLIESIDGRAVGSGVMAFAFEFSRQKKHVLSVVRNREKSQVELEASN